MDKKEYLILEKTCQIDKSFQFQSEIYNVVHSRKSISLDLMKRFIPEAIHYALNNEIDGCRNNAKNRRVHITNKVFKYCSCNNKTRK